ncbi:GIY-YIG nuclease family protein [Cribrihabitans neustonicus]|uniref:GIY-YIG nuclease family protein n=1 Tax=Cribrihabitans neustonicus TaxID=1429085 RepID=UPI003B5BB912
MSSCNFVNLPGVSGTSYPFSAKELDSGLGQFIGNAGGVYTFMVWRPLLRNYEVLYVGIAGEFSKRFSDHEKWADARRLGANSVGIYFEGNDLRRRHIEEDLIRSLQPSLNVQHRSLAGGFANALRGF